MKYTEAKDDASDKKSGIKENSKRDMKLDKSRGLKSESTKVSKAAQHTSKVPPAIKGKMGHPAGRTFSRMKPQATVKSTKVSKKVANTSGIPKYLANRKVFKD